MRVFRKNFPGMFLLAIGFACGYLAKSRLPQADKRIACVEQEGSIAKK